MNGPQIRGSLITNQVENHAGLIQWHLDFSLIKVEAPSEYKDIGQSLSARRRNDADEGQSHLTAAQLGALFGGLVPREKVSNLIRAYGLRCSDTANSPTFNPKGSSQHGLFANEVGADGTAVWAAATSGESAIAVHLLGCMLSRMWDPPEAISIWMQLITERKKELERSGDPYECHRSRDINPTRDQIASWHTSIQAWRQTADEANALRQNQLLLIINNLGIPVNTKLCLSDSVIDAWIAAMITVDKLVSGKPQSVQTGAPLLGLAAWHLYPNMIVYGQGRNATPTEVCQNDPHIHRGGVLTLGIQDHRRVGDGIYWSLPLAYLRYYGQPVPSEARLSSRTSRASIDDLMYVALGSLIRRWLADADDIELAAQLLVRLNKLVELGGNLYQDTWISLIAASARTFLNADSEAKAAQLQLIKCGRRRYPLFVDDPAADTIFGLSSPKTFLGLLPDNAQKVIFLRRIARDFTDEQNLLVIQCNTGNASSQWDINSVGQFPTRSKRKLEELEMECINTTKRHLRWLNEHHEDRHEFDTPPDADEIRLQSPIPWLSAPNGYQWQNPPWSFYCPLLEAEAKSSDWRQAKGITIRSVPIFGDPDIAALYRLDIHYWTSHSPNEFPKTIPGARCRDLPNIVILRHVLWALEEPWSMEESLLNRTLLFQHLEEGIFSKKILTSLRALQTVSSLYTNLHNATIELRTAEQPLYEHQWIPASQQGHRHLPFAGYVLDRMQMFACIAKFESGGFNFHPSAMNGVLAISSGNSLYVASCLLQDPCKPQWPRTINRVVGNLGKTGMALLVSPAVPQMRSLSDDVRLVNHHPFDGGEEDAFPETSLHISYTDWQLPIDIGSRGKRDVEAYYVEAAIGLYDRGKWVADLNILDVFNHRLSQIVPRCTQHPERSKPIDETSKYVAIDSWEELLDSPTEVGVVRARGNWQARLAAAALSIQRGHETRIVPESTCWLCCLSFAKVPPLSTAQDDDAHAYDDVFGVVPWVSEDEGSDSEAEGVFRAAARKNGHRHGDHNGRTKAHDGTGEDRERNIVYIL
jgi:hypothetical protein